MTAIKSRDLRSKAEWIEMFPYGLAMSPGSSRPVMIFKDESGQKVLPVWLSPLDAGIAVNQSGGGATDTSPHHLTWKILEPLGVKLKKCFFTEVRGHHQFVKLHFSGNENLRRLESRADEAISFCLSTECKFYCRLEFIERCRILDVEMAMAVGKDSQDANPHPYLN